MTGDIPRGSEMPPEHAPLVPLSAVVAEYGALRDEITQRISSQTTLAAGGIAGVGALMALAPNYLTWIPAISFILSALYQGHTYWIHQAGMYIRTQLWPRLTPDIPDEEMWQASYEHFIFTNPPRITLHGAFSWVAEGAAPLLFILVGVISISRSHATPTVLVINWVLVALIAITALAFGASHRIGRERSPVPPLHRENGEG